jgi:beta-lactamase class A
MTLSRRNLAAVAASAFVVPAIASRAAAQGGGGARVQAAVARFAALPAASCLVVAEHPTAPWQAAHLPEARRFVGSAVKTFILAQYLREVEAGRLGEDQQMTIDDTVRSLSSPVSSTSPARRRRAACWRR